MTKRKQELTEKLRASQIQRHQAEYKRCKEAGYELINLINLNDGTYLIYEKSSSLKRARVSRVELEHGRELAEVNMATYAQERNEDIIYSLNRQLIGA